MRAALLCCIFIYGCATAPATKPVPHAVEEPVVPGRIIRTTTLPADAELRPFAKVGNVAFSDARPLDAIGSYAVLSVGEAPPVWLDLHTDEERAAGASPESGWSWVYAGAAPDGTIIGVLDWAVESSGPELILVASVNGGRSWSERAVIEKPHYMALFQDLSLGASEWVLTVTLDDCGGCGASSGQTTWTSPPGGYTWSQR